ncbi:hypothetical protein ES332_D11G235600v1 [Gossypium tomentosum]|uniref:Chaperone DnaJ C-terminal domain-containing protein n=1 Tax=Gossypium tomentosum TaxID=34277 RepID=A0A5D2IRD7_GOSTO|nr:hypothetical protein ES332_D11G235600v1 [Gossypium tomentosum]
MSPIEINKHKNITLQPYNSSGCRSRIKEVVVLGLRYFLVVEYRKCSGFNKGPPRDLYAYLDVQEVPGIQRDGINLLSTVSISYLDAILGSVVKVKTVEGVTDLQIPPGTQPGDVLVLAGKGAPKLNKPSIRGDHLFTIKVNIPNRISAKERELLEELSSLSNTNSSRSRTRPRTQPATANNYVKCSTITCFFSSFSRKQKKMGSRRRCSIGFLHGGFAQCRNI